MNQKIKRLVTILIISILSFQYAGAIINGKPVNISDYPFMVYIKISADNPTKAPHQCGGTLIGSQYILTAGHCVALDATPNGLFPAKSFTINYTNSYGVNKQVAVAQIFVDPKFKYLIADLPTHDIGIIKLKEPIYDTKFARLPDLSTMDSYYTPGTFVKLIGYGWYDDMQQNSYPILRKSTDNKQNGMIILADDKVKFENYAGQPFSLYNDYYDKTTMVGVSGTEAVWSHDSGSPLLLVNNDNGYTIIGIASSTVSAPVKIQPSIYAKLATAEHMAWINNIIKSTDLQTGVIKSAL